MRSDKKISLARVVKYHPRLIIPYFRYRALIFKKRGLKLLTKLRRVYIRHRLVNSLALATISIFGVSLVLYFINQPNYSLTLAEIRLTGNVDMPLTNKTQFSKKTNSYKLAATQPSASLTIGNNNINRAPYGINLPSDLKKSGITITDGATGLSFTIVPELNAAKVAKISNRFVYPVSKSIKAVYSVKQNGLEEDLIISKPISNITLKYRLKLPGSLVARQLGDGSIGIYSANPVLFGNVSASTPSDQKDLYNLRRNAQKNYLVFRLAPPVVEQTSGGTVKASAKFNLSGNNLTTIASGLSGLHYPISIDPDVVVTSANNFELGNNEGGINIGSTGITEAGINGGSICNSGTSNCLYGFSGWNTANSSPSGFTPVAYASSAIYDGRLYVVGGCYTTTTLCDTLSNKIQYASFGTFGSSPTGGFSSTSWGTLSLPTGLNGVFQAGVAIYDGYLYIVGGCSTITSSTCSANASNVIYWRQLDPNSGGFNANSSWQALNLPSGFGGRFGLSVVTYNDIMYLLGGCTYTSGSGSSLSCTAQKDVWFAQLNADGSVASTSGTANFNLSPDQFNATPRFDFGATAYNGYLYIAGGCSSISAGSCTPTADTEYTALNSINGNTVSSSSPAGAPSRWITGNTPTTAAFGVGLTINNGYIYYVGGCSTMTNGVCGSSASINQIKYTNLNADGELSSWFLDATTLPNSAAGVSLSAFNNYLYASGGSNGTSLNYVVFAPINASLPASSGWQSVGEDGTSAPDGDTIGAGGVILDGYYYWFDGISGSSGTPGGGVYETPINSLANPSVTPTWKQVGTMSTATAFAGYAVSNNDIWVIDGCTNWSTSLWQCTNVFGSLSYSIDTTQYFQANTNNGYLCTPPTPPATTPCTASSATASTPSLAGPIYEPNGNSGGSYADEAIGVNYQGVPYIVVVNGYDTVGDITVCETGYLSLQSDGSWNGSSQWQLSSAILNHTADAKGTYSCLGIYGGGLAYAPDIGSGYLYFVGGVAGSCTGCTGYNVNGNGEDTIYYEPLSSIIGTSGSCTEGGGGTCTTWNVSSQVYPSNAAFLEVGYYGGSLYAAGGATATSETAGDTALNTSYSSGINSSTGDLTGWVSLGTFGSAHSRPNGVVYNGYIYLIGGVTGETAISDAWFDRISTSLSGDNGIWQTYGSNLPDFISANETIAYNNYLYVLGGVTNQGSSATSPAMTNTIYDTEINPGGSLSGSGWVRAATLPSNMFSFGAVAYGGFMYIVGGCNSLPTGGQSPGYGCGSYISGNNIYFAQISSNGSLVAPTSCTPASGVWCELTSSPISAGDWGLNAVAYNGYLYILDGCIAITSSGDCSTFSNSIYYAELTPSGIPEVPTNPSTSSSTCTPVTGVWCQTNVFATPRALAGVTAYDGFMYIADGAANSSPNCSSLIGYCDDVQYAPINPNGSLGSWNYTTPTLGYQTYVSLSGYDGFLYIYGGQEYSTTGGNTFTGTGASSINADGTIGRWSSSYILSSIGSGALYDGYLFIPGGFASGQSSSTYNTSYQNFGYLSSTAFAGLLVFPRVGRYSELIDLGLNGSGGNATPTFIINTGSSIGNPTQVGEAGGITINYETDANTCPGVLNPLDLQTLTLPPPNTTDGSYALGSPLEPSPQGNQPVAFTINQDGCNNITNNARFLWLSYTLDDSETASQTIGSTNPNYTSLSRIDVYYHPSPKARLQGGQTLINGQIQPLDTQP